MPLIIAPLNVELSVIKVSCEEKLAKHLASLGIVPEAVITVTESIKGSIVLMVKDGRLALDKEVASKIFVKQC